jgi:hypothetical protein
MTFTPAPALADIPLPASFRQRLFGHLIHASAVGAAVMYFAFGAIAAHAAEIGTTFEKPCPFGVCKVGEP